MECMKVCFKCNIEKPLNEYYRHPQMLDGHLNKCKDCTKNDVRNNYMGNKEYYKSYDKNRQLYDKQRIFNHRYNQIRQRVEGRATRKYGVEGREMLSYEEYCVWLSKNMNNFERIYEMWKESGFNRKLCPSIDRIDNRGSYTADNMRWVTLRENARKGNKVPF